MPDVPERTGIAKRLIGRHVGDLQSDLSVGKCGCAVPVYDDGHGKVGRGQIIHSVFNGVSSGKMINTIRYVLP